MRLTLSAVSLALLAATTALLAGPQAAPPAPPAKQVAPAGAGTKAAAVGPVGPVVKNVDVSITNLDVVVTDSKGNHVTGLRKEDFEVKEDGFPQPLTNFFAVEGGKLAVLGDEVIVSQPEAPAPAAADPNVAPLPIPRTRIVIFVDNLHLSPFNRNRILRDVEVWCRESVKGNVEAMVVTWDRSLKVRRKFTNDGREISEVLKQVEELTGVGTQTASERSQVLQQIDDAKTEDEAVQRARSYALSLQNDLQFTFDAIKTTINQLSGVEGRKIVMYVSEGLPQSPGAELWPYIQQRFNSMSSMGMQAFQFDRVASYMSIVQAANAAGVTMYMFDAAGLRFDSNVSAENKTNKARIDTFVEQNNLQAMQSMLAEETGGVAVFNRNTIAVNLKEMERDYSSYYSLGYRSLRSGSDRPHKVDVRMKKKGLTVRARRTYVEKGIETRVNEAVTSALFFARDDNPLAIGLETGQPVPADRQNYLVPVRIRIPYARVTLLPDSGKLRGRVFIYFIVLDSDGKQSDLSRQEAAIELDESKADLALRKDFVYDVKLLMIPGGQKLSIAVRDDISNTTSYAQKAIFVSVLPIEMQMKK